MLGRRKQPVGLRHRRVGPAIRGKGKTQSAELLLKRLVGEDRVGRNAQDLGVGGDEAGQISLDRRQLVPSNRGEIERVKQEHDVSTAKRGELKLALPFAGHAGQLEIRGGVACFECHPNLHMRTE